ncbi:MAG TPA: MBL fold metallo-hydrolase [Spirochaetota bacterium]|nr:MBL fold metallo-hydrolase [Spirochaetota bacterium]HPI89572.1 MBL fold metallo-hydrolase [Spirochaetota bacterium]HPR49036.1 MBL fold metallo-hydrolase [Spirochaetota bacterium]
MPLLYLALSGVILFIACMAVKLLELKRGKARIVDEQKNRVLKKISPFGSVEKLTVLPLVDYFSEFEGGKTEPGVSYLVRADGQTILLDVGFNRKQEHPSPLLQNAEKLGVAFDDLDMIFISHLHRDHVGGTANERNKHFSISCGPVSIPPVTVYSPEAVTPLQFHSNCSVEVVAEALPLAPGVASTGPVARQLFLMGRTVEQSLAVNVKGKGIVLIVGCGHQTIERILEEAEKIFDEPIYGVIGGLHYPVRGGRMMSRPVNILNLIGSDRPPWKHLNEQDVESGIQAIDKRGVSLVSLSPHDSSDWALDRFRQSFKERYIDLKVGHEITVTTISP